MNPSISFIIPVYNGETYIARAISSALGQYYDNFDIVVVNDGSTDGTLQVLRSMNDQRLKIIDLEKNQGRSRARNAGVEATSSDYIAFLDADDQIPPDKLSKQMKYVLEHQLDICGAWGHSVDDKKITLFKHPVDDLTIKSRIIKSHTFIHSSVIMKRQLFLQSGGYDPNLNFSEDYDLFLRLVPKAKCGNIPLPLVEYTVPHGFSYALKEQKNIAKVRLRAIMKYGYSITNLFFVLTPVISLFVPRKFKIFLKKIIN